MDTSCLHQLWLVISDGSLDNCPNFRRHKLLKRIPELLWLEFSEFIQCDNLKSNEHRTVLWLCYFSNRWESHRSCCFKVLKLRNSLTVEETAVPCLGPPAPGAPAPACSGWRRCRWARCWRPAPGCPCTTSRGAEASLENIWDASKKYLQQRV